ncbi:MAG: putative F420-0 ABC transporter substrate-binding protein [Micrococcales bacterium]|nr:putative F420-0 ABC transporter substrate-binding protein [Micrococcales bacterium]
MAIGGIALLALLAGCATAPSAAAPTPPPASASAYRPVTLTNCGYRQRIEAAPQRVVAIKSTSIELMLALGLRDRIVGTAFQDGPVPARWKADAATLPRLAEQFPSEEATLGLKPDLVYSGWESAFTPQSAGARSELTSLGVASYVQPAACRSAGQPGKLTFTNVFAEIREAGRIFGVADRAGRLVAAQEKQLAAVKPDTRKLTALWYSSGDQTPYVGAGIGAPQMVLEAAGLTNIAGSVKQTWTTLGWESIVADDPDVIVLVDADWNTAQAKIDALEKNPATAQLGAVKNRRYLTLPFPASEAGVRSVDAVRSLTAQLKEIRTP